MCRSSAILLPTLGTVNRLLGSFIFLATVVYLLFLPQLLGMLPNVQRYVTLPRSRGGMSFCYIVKGSNYSFRHKMQPVAASRIKHQSTYHLSRWRIGEDAKTMTPAGGPRRQPGRAEPPSTQRSSLARRLSRYGAAMAYTGLLGTVAAF